ncbi:MAG TPA: hypothetical protein VGS22_25765 [Thermoanaerobaculia bacterium]|jgi:hypothetical protein|nr:hypothetical protein [Thermoanaerobaculia bacterium]
MGVNRVSFYFEIYTNARSSRTFAPAKTKRLDRYLRAVRYCAALADQGPKNEPWVTHGETIAGLESPESSIAAID